MNSAATTHLLPYGTAVAAPNPFATRFIRPDAISFAATDSVQVADLERRLKELDFRAAIVGPHGAGKTCLWSTLLHQLDTKYDIRIIRVCLPREHRWSDAYQMVKQLPKQVAANRVVMGVDGFEQLRSWQRALLVHQTRHRNLGLLVTSHREFAHPFMRLPTLCVIRPNISSLRQALLAIRDRWLQELRRRHPANTHELVKCERDALARFDLLLTDSELHDVGEKYRWDIREVLFALYDKWESDQGPCPSTSISAAGGNDWPT